MDARTTGLAVLAGIVTVIFVLCNITMLVLFGAYPTEIAKIHWVSRYWADLCFAFVFFQFLPLLTAHTMGDRGYKLDKFTTPAAFVTTIFVIVTFVFFVKGGEHGAQIARYNGYASFLDILFLVELSRLRRAGPP